jgi:hypothetical protein
MMKMKKKYREVHINNESWKYVIDYNRESWTEPTNIRIYDPNKKMYRLNSDDLESAARVQPSHIKNYIIENLVK